MDLDRQYLAKYGHKFYKVYEKGDENRYVFPERDVLSGDDMMLYHRYRRAVFIACDRQNLRWRGYDMDMPHVYMTRCDCNHYGRLCRQCETLNTSDFYGLQVPLNPEDFEKMNATLSAQGLTPVQIYAWLFFWIEQISIRYTEREDRLIFWAYPSFGCHSRYNSPHKMFRHLMRAIVPCSDRRRITSSHPTRYFKPRPESRPVDADTIDIRTCNAFISLSLERYGRGEQIRSIETIYRRKKRHWSRITWARGDSGEMERRMQEPFRKQFRACLSEIQEEVAYRPGMVMMKQAEEDFYSHTI